VRRISCRKRSRYAALLAAGPALTWRMKISRTREAGQPPAAQTNARGSRLPRRTAKRHPALHGGSLHLEPVWFYRQSRRDERVSVLEAPRIGNRVPARPASVAKAATTAALAAGRHSSRAESQTQPLSPTGGKRLMKRARRREPLSRRSPIPTRPIGPRSASPWQFCAPEGSPLKPGAFLPQRRIGSRLGNFPPLPTWKPQ